MKLRNVICLVVALIISHHTWTARQSADQGDEELIWPEAEGACAGCMTCALIEGIGCCLGCPAAAIPIAAYIAPTVALITYTEASQRRGGRELNNSLKKRTMSEQIMSEKNDDTRNMDQCDD